MGYVSVDIAGEQKTFRRLTADALVRIGTLAHAKEREQIGDALDCAEIKDDVARFAAYRQHNERRNTLDSLIVYAISIPGALDIVRTGLDGSADAWIEAHDSAEWVALALDLIGATRRPQGAAEGKAEGRGGATS